MVSSYTPTANNTLSSELALQKGKAKRDNRKPITEQDFILPQVVQSAPLIGNNVPLIYRNSEASKVWKPGQKVEILSFIST